MKSLRVLLISCFLLIIATGVCSAKTYYGVVNDYYNYHLYKTTPVEGSDEYLDYDTDGVMFELRFKNGYVVNCWISKYDIKELPARLDLIKDSYRTDKVINVDVVDKIYDEDDNRVYVVSRVYR